MAYPREKMHAAGTRLMARCSGAFGQGRRPSRLPTRCFEVQSGIEDVSQIGLSHAVNASAMPRRPSAGKTRNGAAGRQWPQRPSAAEDEGMIVFRRGKLLKGQSGTTENVRKAFLVAIASLVIGIAGISRASSFPVREHCGPDAHRNAWGRCVPDRLGSCPPDWHRNRWGICVRK